MLGKPLSQLEVGERIYSLDFQGNGEVTVIHTKSVVPEFVLSIVDGPNKGEVAVYPVTSIAEAFDVAR